MDTDSRRLRGSCAGGDTPPAIEAQSAIEPFAKYKNAAGRIAIVPRPKQEIPIGTTRSIIRQSGLTPQDFGF